MPQGMAAAAALAPGAAQLPVARISAILPLRSVTAVLRPAATGTSPEGAAGGSGGGPAGEPLTPREHAPLDPAIRMYRQL